jgi:GT2 family glycosyltransferase
MRNVVILGMHRSGTSMVAEALASAGVYVGEDAELLRGQEDNPHGFWEREDVVALNEAILEANGAAWYSPPRDTPEASDAQRSEMAAILARLPRDRSWQLKDPRQVLTWPLWQESLGDAVLVFVYRDPVAVATSLRRRNGFPLSMSFLLWEHYNRRALSALAGRDTAALSYEAVARDPAGTLSALLGRLAALGVACDTALDPAVFDASLGRSAGEAGSSERALLTESQRQLAACCEAVAAGDPLPALPPADARAWSQLADMASAMAPLATVLETRNALREATALCEERTRERDHSLSALRQLESQHQDLARAHDKEQEQHRRLEKQHRALDEEHHKLAAAHRAQVREYEALVKKADYLFSTLTHTYRSLLQFELSSLAGVWRGTARIYKLATLRRGSNSSYDDALADARTYFEEHSLEVPRKPPGKLSLLGDVARYVFENPAGSARSFSWARLQRALSVFLRSSPDDLEVWVNSRFPERSEGGAAFEAPGLDAGLDELRLQFPAVDEPLVSIIIPVYNEYRVTVNCLRALLEHTTGVSYEIILADDCSTDLTATIDERIANIRVVRGSENLRFIGNCNRAAGHARGRYLLFLNNDTAVCPDWLPPLVEVLETRESAGIVGPRLLFPNGKLQEAGAIMWRDGSAWNFGRMDDPEKPDYCYLKETDYISGACLMIRHHLWQQLGGFDTRYAPAYCEDADLAFAARQAGYQVVYQPLSSVFHFEGVSHGTDLDAGIKQYQVRNQARFREKWAEVLDAGHFDNAEHVPLARDRSRYRRSVLYIDHYVPHYDKDAGSRSTFMWVQQMLEMGYRVMFLGANFFPHQPYTRTLQQMGVEVLTGEFMARNQDRWLRDNAPYIDRIYLHRPHVAEQFLGALERMKPRPPIIFFGHDLHYLRIRREYEVAGDDSLLRSSQKWREREFAVFDRVDKVYYPSDVEVAEITREKPDLDARAIPLYILPEADYPPYDFDRTADILFVGGFNHPPNVDGVCWFVEEVLPLVSAARPDIRLHVVGSNPTDAVEALQGDRVVVYGYLSDEELDALYRRIRQVVVPLRFGAGVKGKVLEAIQKNRPVVTTSLGAEGIPEAESVMNIADTAAELASLVRRADEGDPACIGHTAAYPEWLRRHFGKASAAAIIEEDFGEPLRTGGFVVSPGGVDDCAEAI